MNSVLRKTSAGLLALSTVLFAATSSSALSEVDKEKKPLDECIAQNRKLSVLFLVDESVSLTKNKKNPKGTDPENLRVKALQAAAAALSSLTTGDEQDRIEVEASIAGFGDGYEKHLDWTPLNSSSISSISDELAKQAKRNTYYHTRYNEALKGAVASFKESSGKDESCRLLIWFSDGQHDFDDKRGLSKIEKRQISKDLCEPGGYVDQLRGSGVFIQAVGLNDSSQAMELMKIIAVRDGLFEADGLSLSSCGDRPGLGKFTWVREADGLIDALISGESVLPNKCADGTPQCFEFAFEVDESVSRFRFLVTTPTSGINSTTVTAGQGNSFNLFVGNEKNPIDVVTTTSLTPNKVLLDVLREDGESIAGGWKIRFIGPKASEAAGKVSFVGDTTLKVTDGVGKPLKNIDRFKTSGLKAQLSKVSEGSRIQSVEFAFKYLQDEIKISARSIGGNEFAINKNAVVQLLSKGGKFSSASSIDVAVQPLGYVQGLKDEDGKDIAISYRPTILRDVLISDGDQQPLVRSVLGQDGEKVEFEGTTKQTAYFTFKGADAADTKVVFSSVEGNPSTNPKKFSVISQEQCVVPRGQEEICKVEIKPEVKGYGPYEVPLTITYSNSSGTKKVLYLASFDMKTKPDPWPGIKRAGMLLLLFLVVQLSLRAGFAVLMTRFAKLNGTSHRVRIPVSLDGSGRITPRGSAQFSVLEDGYAVENNESLRKFAVFGINFSCSPMRTFLKSTVTPIGQATAEGTHIFGSAGSRSKNDLTIGLVNLALRNQWVLRVSKTEMENLAAGVNSISGEIIAFFDPYDLKPIDTQVQSLGTSVISSAIPETIRSVAENIKNALVSKEDGAEKKSADQAVPQEERIKNPFGTSITEQNPVSAQPASKQPKKEKQKKSKKEKASPVVEPSQETKPQNPFAK